jgi:hypothetical protein
MIATFGSQNMTLYTMFPLIPLLIQWVSILIELTLYARFREICLYTGFGCFFN